MPAPLTAPEINSPPIPHCVPRYAANAPQPNPIANAEIP